MNSQINPKNLYFDEDEIQKAKEVLNKHAGILAGSNNEIFNNSIGATFDNYDFTNMGIKRSYLTGCIFINANFTGAAVTGSHFISTKFNNCIIEGTNFQCCDFTDCFFKNDTEEAFILSSNMSNSNFTNTVFKRIVFRQNTIYQSIFDECIFEDCILTTTTLEGSIFNNCRFTNMDMRIINMDYISLNNPKMENVILPFYQIPYVLNGLNYILNTNDQVWIESECSLESKIRPTEYYKLLDYMGIFFFDKDEFFPLINIYLAQNKPATALEFAKEGIRNSVKFNDFRMIKHICRLITSTTDFSPKEIKEIYYLIEELYNPKYIDKNNIISYLNNISEIKNILLKGDFNQETLEILIKTNIDASDATGISDFIKELTVTLDNIAGDSRSQYIELRHQSDYSIIFTCVNIIEEIIPILVSFYAFFGVVDKSAKFYDTLLNIKQKKKTKKESVITVESKSEKDEAYESRIRELEKQVKELKSEKRELNKTQKLLTDAVVELSHMIKGSESLGLNKEVLITRVELSTNMKN